MAATVDSSAPSAPSEQATAAPLSSPAPTAALSNTARDRAAHRLHEHGNYYGYYGFRTQTIPDARLSLLPCSLFEGKRILDLGCNAGKLTLEVLNHLGATRSRGVDIDAHLISQAEAATKQGQLGIEWICADFMEESYEFEEWDTVSNIAPCSSLSSLNATSRSCC